MDLRKGIDKLVDRNPFDLSDENIKPTIRPYRAGSLSQEIGSTYDNLSDKHGLDFNELVYGNKGFMKTKYPNGFPDFRGDIIYSDKYFQELDDWFKENTGISLGDRAKYVKAKRKELYGINDYDDKEIEYDSEGLRW